MNRATGFLLSMSTKQEALYWEHVNWAIRSLLRACQQSNKVSAEVVSTEHQGLYWEYVNRATRSLLRACEQSNKVSIEGMSTEQQSRYWGRVNSASRSLLRRVNSASRSLLRSSLGHKLFSSCNNPQRCKKKGTCEWDVTAYTGLNIRVRYSGSAHIYHWKHI